MEGDILEEITYTNKKVEKYFKDYNKMQKKLPFEWVKTIKKHMRYSLHVAPNARLIIEPNATQDTVMICTEVEVKGVSDYHGSKENWYIP